MKAINKFIIVLFTATLFTDTKAQEVLPGQQCQDIVFSFLHEPVTKKLSDYKGRFILVDFWSTNCAACIKSFPKMEALQKQFNEKMQMFFVNNQSADSTARFFAKRKKIIKPAGIPFIAGDSAFHSFFPHTGVPYIIWMDTTGKVLAATGPDEVHALNIRKLLSGEEVDWVQKREIKDWNPQLPLLANADSSIMRKQLFGSYLMRSVDGANMLLLSRMNGSRQSNRLFINPAGIIKLLQTAFSEKDKYNFRPLNTVILEVKDSSRFIPPPQKELKAQWLKDNTYAYEVWVPAAEVQRLYQFMQEDLLRYFHLRVCIERREIKCWVLQPDKGFNNSKTQVAGKQYVFTDKPFASLFRLLKNSFNAEFISSPLIDATGYKGNITAGISKEALTDIRLLQKELKSCGINLEEKLWLTDVLVVKDQM